MSHKVEVPPPSLMRLRNLYAQFEQASLMIAEAIGVSQGDLEGIDLPNGVFLVKDTAQVPNGKVEATA